MSQEQQKTQEQILNELSQATGTEHYYKIPFSDYVFTDGIKNLIELCRCNWLISDYGILLSHKKELEKPFLILTIEKTDDNKAKITLKEDSNEPILYEQDLSYTDFPLNKFEFYIIDKVMLLKSEY